MLNVSAATSGNYTYKVTDGKATITDVDTSISGDVVIPSTLGGYPVTSIGRVAFYWCESLESITIPDSVTSIGNGAFYYCHSLETITIPDSVTSIGSSAFVDCYSLTSVTIGNGVTSIGEGAFSRCYSLTSVTIGNGVTSIGSYAFSDCDSLAKINVDNNNQFYADIDGVLFDKSKTEIIRYPEGKTATSYTIPDSVTSIGEGAFDGCDSLTSVKLGNSVTSIGSSAFWYCLKLTSITIPDSVTSIGVQAFLSCESLTSITIPDNVTSIGIEAFYDCSSLTSVNIGNSVTNIGRSAFSGCSSLKKVFYRGSSEDETKITIESNNSPLTNATWYYNSCIGAAEHTYDSECDAFCDVCADKREVNHTFGDDGLCTQCGKPPYTVGDLNGDYAVTTTDLAVMKLFLAGISELDGTGLLAGDLDGDGNVNTTDLASLKLKLAGIE